MDKSRREILERYDNNFYKIMSENFGDEIFVTDGEGIILFLNLASAKDIGANPQDLVGRHVMDVVNEGKFSPSVSMEVIKQKKTVNILQKLYDGRTVLCSGVPVFDNDQETIKMVVSTTKKVDEINELVEKMQFQEGEIENLRNIAFEEEGFISDSNDKNNIKATILKVSPLDVPILIQGETGVGKGVVAKTIHRFKYGKSKPMIKINCGTIPEYLIESELFGYERGAFTGARNEGKIGKVELAEGGTLFLDEIGELPLALQVKLLDFMQDGTFTRVGGTKVISVNTRIIAATNRDLKKMSETGEFRKDLYYRINVVPLTIPPLRERPNDLDALLKHFLSSCNYKYKTHKKMNTKAIKRLHEYEWPGNVRELEHMIENIHIFSEGQIITDDDVLRAMNEIADPNSIHESFDNKGKVVCNGIMPLKEAKSAVEKQLVEKAYELYGSTYKAARALHVDQSTVAKIMKKYSEPEE